MSVEFAVGKEFPLPYRSFDALTPFLDGPTVSFVVTMNAPTEKEITGIRKGKVNYGVYVSENVPFIVWDFAGAKVTLDCYINIWRETIGSAGRFINGSGNLLSIFLVDCTTGILHGIRTIGAEHEFMDTIKAACNNQLISYWARASC